MEFPLLSFIEHARKEGKSKAYIDEITKYIKNLEEYGYPIIFTLEHFAVLLKIQSDFLKHLLEYSKDSFHEEIYGNHFTGAHLNQKYDKFNISKRKGGIRVIVSPHEDLKYIQKWLLYNILEHYDLSPNCTGFRKGKSIKHNALPHVNAQLILKVDLLRFFDSIEEKRVFGCFKTMGYNGNLALDFARLCTVQHDKNYWDNLQVYEIDQLFGNNINFRSRVLPQGAPTSPALANIIASKMDKRFAELGVKLNFAYTRYADDLTFSIKGDGKLPTLSVIKKIISDEGFILNERKTRYSKRGKPQYVTGLTVSNGVNINKRYRKEIERHIFFCRKFGVEAHLTRNKKTLFGFNTISFHDWLFGHLCYIKSVNEKAYEKMFEEYKKVNWFI